jgi:ribosomal protein S18 acetylase RimI-like enzyme
MFDIRFDTRATEPPPFGFSAPPDFLSRSFDLGGESLVMRKLHGADLDEIERHFLELARLDRAARFMSAPSDEAVRAYARRIDPSSAAVIGAFAPAGRLVGLAEAQPTEKPGTVEIAVTVAGDYQRKGLGRELVRRLVALAFANGAQAAEFYFCPSNKPIIRIVSSLGGRFGKAFGQASISRAANIDR